MPRRTACGFALLFLFTGTAVALPAYGPFEVNVSVQSQTLIRHPDIDTFKFIQNRNTLRARLDYRLLDKGKLFSQWNFPWLNDARVYVLYRGVYDSVYDAAPGGNLYDILRRPAGSLADVPGSRRDQLKFENDLREAYVDLELRYLPLTLRLGKQQVVWGETDNFRMLDRANPLDLTWHQLYESWDDLRIPLWILKGLWRFEQIGPLTDAFIEAFWNPGDWVPAKQAFLPENPWGIPQISPLTGLVGPPPAPFQSLYKGTRLFRQGDYTRNPGDNSQVGVRFSAVAPGGVQFTLNYFYQRWAGDDGTNYAPVRAVTDVNEATAAVARGEAPIEFIAPYVHTAGMSLNYSEDRYTQTVLRLETVYDFGVPFSDTAKPSPLFGNLINGVTKKDMWKGMIAFDRPTWIRSLNRTSTFFITGQFFWHDLINREASFVGNIDPSVPSHDKVRRWEAICTLLVTTIYGGGSIIPTVQYALDPVNSYNMYVGWTLDYFLTNDLIVRIGQNYFLAGGSVPAFESWSLGGFNRGRSESLLRLTYQF